MNNEKDRQRRYFTYLKIPSFLILCLLNTLAYSKDLPLYFYGDTSSNEWYGAIQGLQEANAQGKFLQLNYKLIHRTNLDDVKADKPYAVISSLSPAKLRQALLANPQIPFLNVSSIAEHFSSLCAPNLFHIRPHPSALVAAEAAWKPEGRVEAKAVLWHHSFKKYAAAQLNKRYKKNADRHMNSESWAGWASVKLFSDTLARNGPESEISVVNFLKNSLAFDGQKGKDLFFNGLNYLEQPLLLIHGDKIVGEISTSQILSAESGAFSCK